MSGPYQHKDGNGKLGSRLKTERIRRGFTIRRFADLVGVNQAQLTAYENRGVKPSFDVFVAMAQVLECSLDWLAGIES